MRDWNNFQIPVKKT